MAAGDAEPRAVPVAHLIRLGSDGEPQQWPIAEGNLTVGRAKDCQIWIPNTCLSRRHTQLRCEGRRTVITDLGSANGTFVNGVQVQEAQELRHGDLVRVGPLEFRYESLTPAEPEVPERPTIVMGEPSRVPRLEVSGGQQRGLVFDLVRERMVIGRVGQGQQWDIVLPDRAVSAGREDGRVVVRFSVAALVVVVGDEDRRARPALGRLPDKKPPMRFLRSFPV